jgi:hypothetical protein
LNAISKELSQGNLIRVRPPDPTPKEVSYGETVTVKLSVSGNIRESYDKLERQIKEVDEASGEEDRCVDLTESMEAKLFSPRFSQQGNGLPIRRINRDTTWSWDIIPNTEGKHSLDVLLGHVRKQTGSELASQWIEPAPLHHGVITVRARLLGQGSSFVARSWQWLLPVGIALAIAAALLVRMLRRHE